MLLSVAAWRNRAVCGHLWSRVPKNFRLTFSRGRRMSLPEFSERRPMNSIESAGHESSRIHGATVSASAASPDVRWFSSEPAGRDRAGGIWPIGEKVRAGEVVESAQPDPIIPSGTSAAASQALAVGSRPRPAPGRFAGLGVFHKIEAGSISIRVAREPGVAIRAVAFTVRR